MSFYPEALNVKSVNTQIATAPYFKTYSPLKTAKDLQPKTINDITQHLYMPIVIFIFFLILFNFDLISDYRY